MGRLDVDNFRIQMDHYLDYVPGVSTLTNFVDLFQKLVYNGQEPPVSTYGEFITEKSTIRCLIGMVPIVGNVALGIFDYTKANSPQFDDFEPGEYHEENLDITNAPEAVQAQVAISRKNLETEIEGDPLVFIRKVASEDPYLEDPESVELGEIALNYDIFLTRSPFENPVTKDDIKEWVDKYEDKKFMLEQIQAGRLQLKHAGPKLRKDKDIVSAAFEKFGTMQQPYADPLLLRDKQVLAALRKWNQSNAIKP
jgi:hypothetical protein